METSTFTGSLSRRVFLLRGGGTGVHGRSGTYLRGNVVWSTTEGTSSVRSKHILLAHTKVCQFAVAVSVQDDIV